MDRKKNRASPSNREPVHRRHQVRVHWKPQAGYEAILNTDGSLSDATGKWGAVIRRRDGMVLAAAHGTSRFNNIAFIEMEALFRGLTLALEKGLTSLEACTDSMAVIHILKSNEPPWEIKNMHQHFTKLDIHHIYREANQLADRIAACSPALAYVEIIPSSFSEDLKKIVFEDSIGKEHLRMKNAVPQLKETSVNEENDGSGDTQSVSVTPKIEQANSVGHKGSDYTVYELPQSRTSEKRESDKRSSNNTDDNCDKHIDICPVKYVVPKLKLSLLHRNREKRTDRERTEEDPIHLRPGMVLLKNFISHADQDRDESPESLKRGLPVVSFSIGDSAQFLYGDERDEDKVVKVELKSGVVLIFKKKNRKKKNNPGLFIMGFPL